MAPSKLIIIFNIICCMILYISFRIAYLNLHSYIKRETVQSPVNTHNSTLYISKIKQRTILPPKCNDSTHSLLHIKPSDHNWAPYYFRCDFHSKERRKHPWTNEAFVSKQLFYVHVFKAGGTTIQSSLNTLMNTGHLNKLTAIDNHYILSGDEIAKYSTHKNAKYSQNKILEFMDKNATLFSFVRDPLDKFLSAFFEAHTRMFSTFEGGKIDTSDIPMINNYDAMSGIEIMRAWIDAILDSMSDQYLSELERKRKKIQQYKLRQRQHINLFARKRHRKHGLDGNGDGMRRILAVNYINSHLIPSTKFIMGSNWSTNIPFNFIGNLKNFENDFPQIVEPLIVDGKLKQNASALMELLNVKRSRNERMEMDVSLMKYNIDRDKLSDADVENICEIYWLDYLCFPFDIPVQCDLEKLMSKHYGKDVEYKECY